MRAAESRCNLPGTQSDAYTSLQLADRGGAARRFVSTSDDKTIRVWELGIPVQIKYIADPSMHSMPAVGVHPGGKHLSFQSLDNQIVTYNCKDKFKIDRKKNFKGHTSSGNACQVRPVPDFFTGLLTIATQTIPRLVMTAMSQLILKCAGSRP